MNALSSLEAKLTEQCGAYFTKATLALNELTLEVPREHLLTLCQQLRDNPEFAFNMLVDVVGLDYLHYGLDEWQTQSATLTGFGRGVTANAIREEAAPAERFAVVYHLLSLEHNWRLRLRVSLPDHTDLILDSVVPLWPSANWHEREVFDLFGIFFHGHPDLRRILTDYGFVGHPFRKDFPLIGKVEARYDAAAKAVIYEPVSITPRILEPKVIRFDNRYAEEGEHTRGSR